MQHFSYTLCNFKHPSLFQGPFYLTIRSSKGKFQEIPHCKETMTPHMQKVCSQTPQRTSFAWVGTGIVPCEVLWVLRVWQTSAKFQKASETVQVYPSLSSRSLILDESRLSSPRMVTKCLTQKLLLQTHTCLLKSSLHKDREHTIYVHN